MKSSELYFTSDWIIRPAVNYVRLVGIARELGCELAIAQANIVTPERLVMMRFALRAPSQAVFNVFFRKVSEVMDDWQPSDMQTFELAQPFDLHLLEADFLTRWMDAMHAYGLHNAALLKQQQDNK
jgi:hypothetical protein